MYITVYCQVQLQGFCFVVATTCRLQWRHHRGFVTGFLSIESPVFYRRANAPPQFLIMRYIVKQTAK